MMSSTGSPRYVVAVVFDMLIARDGQDREFASRPAPGWDARDRIGCLGRNWTGRKRVKVLPPSKTLASLISPPSSTPVRG